VSVDEMWSRAGDMYFMSGHVNLQLERRMSEMHGSYDRVGLYTIDFLPGSESVGLHTRVIGEETILSMYMNNRAAEAMVAGQLDDAYWRAREAIRLDPTFLSAYNTLGVIYLRHGDAERAQQVLRYVVDRVPDNPRVLANYVDALRRLGRNDEATQVQAKLDKLEPYPPFYFFNRGQAAMAAGDFKAARDWFKKELDRSPDYHEFHYWLAIADFGLGRLDEARSELSIALEDATRRSDRDLYAVKLDKLKAYRQATHVQ
jgi:tetratricopeptide (TPR) repeat protein